MRWFVPPMMLLVLGSCTAPAPRPPAPPPVVEDARPAPDLRAMLAELRAAADDVGDVIHVAPLRDPAVQDLLDEAAEFERIGEITAAANRLQQALALTPGDPQLMQEYAEYLFVLERFEDAALLAEQSFEAGPRLGGLCRRNWATVQRARELLGNSDAASAAAEHSSRCIVEPQLRM